MAYKFPPETAEQFIDMVAKALLARTDQSSVSFSAEELEMAKAMTCTIELGPHGATFSRTETSGGVVLLTGDETRRH